MSPCLKFSVKVFKILYISSRAAIHKLFKGTFGILLSMAIVQSRSRRKITGGRYIASHKKKLRELGRPTTLTKLGADKIVQLRVRGGNEKVRLLTAETVNVFDPSAKKCSKLKIQTIVDNPANRHFIRRNIITKGAVLKTEKGDARVTSRPAQDGVINAILIKK